MKEEVSALARQLDGSGGHCGEARDEGISEGGAVDVDDDELLSWGAAEDQEETRGAVGSAELVPELPEVLGGHAAVLPEGLLALGGVGAGLVGLSGDEDDVGVAFF